MDELVLVHARPHERREPRYAAVGQFLVAERDHRADGRWLLALPIGEAGADGELGAVGQLHEQSAQAAFVSTVARLVADHPGFGIVKCLDLEQGRRAAGHVA